MAIGGWYYFSTKQADTLYAYVTADIDTDYIRSVLGFVICIVPQKMPQLFQNYIICSRLSYFAALLSHTSHFSTNYI